MSLDKYPQRGSRFFRRKQLYAPAFPITRAYLPACISHQKEKPSYIQSNASPSSCLSPMPLPSHEHNQSVTNAYSGEKQSIEEGRGYRTVKIQKLHLGKLLASVPDQEQINKNAPNSQIQGIHTCSDIDQLILVLHIHLTIIRMEMLFID